MSARYLDVAAAAVYTGRSVHTIRKAAETGALKGFKPGGYTKRGRWAFTTDQLDAWMTAGSNGPVERRKSA